MPFPTTKAIGEENQDSGFAMRSTQVLKEEKNISPKDKKNNVQKLLNESQIAPN